MAGAGASPTRRQARARWRGLTFCQPSVRNVPVLKGPCDPGSPCAAPASGRRVPRLHGPSEASIPDVPELDDTRGPGNPCAGGAIGRRVPRSHGPSERRVNGTRVNFRLPSRPAAVPLERPPGAGRPTYRGRCPGARRAACAILPGAGRPTYRGRCPTGGRAGGAIVERCARPLPSGHPIPGSSSGKPEDHAGRVPGAGAARG
jgi:hypothetical protein